MKRTKPERLILKIPKQLWLLKSRGLACCMPKNNAIVLLVASIFVVGYLTVFHYYFFAPFPTMAIEVTALSALFALVFLSVLPTIFIRKDCFECQFCFHIIAHERNHLLLNSTDEAIVEEETLKQTSDRFIPILLSNPRMCKDCLIKIRKLYCQVTSNYLKGTG